jgi:hypothetical protein
VKIRKSKTLIASAAVLALVPGAFLATPASAVEIEKQGNCSMGSVFSAEIEKEFNVWDLSFDVDTKDLTSNWRLIVNQNGNRVLNSRAEAVKDFDDSYAEVEWNVIRPDRSGTDRFFMSAKNLTTGEICKVTLRG